MIEKLIKAQAEERDSNDHGNTILHKYAKVIIKTCDLHVRKK